MARPLKLLSHFIIEYKVTFLYENIYNFDELFLTDDNLSLLVLIFLSLNNSWLLLNFFFLISEAYPLQPQLLIMDNHITFNDLFLQFLNLLFIHRLDLIVSF